MASGDTKQTTECIPAHHIHIEDGNTLSLKQNGNTLHKSLPNGERTNSLKNNNCTASDVVCKEHVLSIQGYEQSIQGHEQSIQGHEQSIHGHEQSIHGHEQSIHGHEQSIHGQEQSIHGQEQSIHGQEQSIQGHALNIQGHEVEPKRTTDVSSDMESLKVDDDLRTTTINAQGCDGDLRTNTPSIQYDTNDDILLTSTSDLASLYSGEHKEEDKLRTNSSCLPVETIDRNNKAATLESDTESSSSNSESSSSKLPLTKHQKLVLLSLSLSCILDNAAFSILLPFFPLEAEKKGVSSTITGLIFGIYELVTFFMCPIFGKYLPVIGAKFMYLSGLFVAGGCNLLFGVLYRLDGTEFVVYCFVIRSVEAVGAAACLTALYVIVAETCPNRVGQAIGLIETMSGIGFMLGPPVGGVLYELGGYQLPFLCLGVATILGVICNIFLLPTEGDSHKEPGSIVEVLRILPIWPVLIALFVGSIGLGFLDPSLSPHLTNFHLAPWAVGLFFLISGGLYAASSPVFGYLADNWDVTRIMMVLGFCICGFGYLLLGPSKLLNLPNELWIVAVGLAFLGVGWGCVLVPPFQDMLMSAVWYGLPDNTQTHGVISGLYTSVYALGCFAGPSLAGVMIDHFGFQLSSTILAGTCFLTTIGLGLFCCWEFQCGKGRRRPHKQRHTEEDTLREETEPLLANDIRSINTFENSLQDPVA